MGLPKEREFIATSCSSPTLTEIVNEYEEKGVTYKPERKAPIGGCMNTSSRDIKTTEEYRLEAGAGGEG